MSETPDEQSWAEAVMETVADEAEQRRLIGMYEPDEMATALMHIGAEVLSIKRALAAERPAHDATKAERDALRAENQRLREALQSAVMDCDHMLLADESNVRYWRIDVTAMQNQMRAALAAKEP